MEVKNVFSILPENFFSALTGKYSQLIAECISILYHKTKSSYTYTIERKFAIDILEDHISNDAYQVEDEDAQTLKPGDAALFVLKKLKDCGWLEEELGKDYQTFYSISDYAIEIIQTLNNLSKENDAEYSGYVYVIYHMLTKFELSNGHISLEQVYLNTEELFRKLSTLNTSLKKYIQTLITGKDRNSLQALLNQFLNDFQAKIVDRSYYNLMTKDHPEKYKQAILNKCYELYQDEEKIQILALQMSDTKDISKEEAQQKILSWLSYVIDCFEEIGEIMDSINDRLNQYIKSAVSRITYLLGVQEDLEGRLNRMMKYVSEDKVDLEHYIKLQKISMISKDSLYVERQRKKPIMDCTIPLEQFDDLFFQEKMEQLAQQNRYAKKAIDEFVDAQLGNRYSMKASELIIEEEDLYTYPILIFLYGYSTNMNYCIEPLRQKVQKFSLSFQDYMIRRVS